MLCVHCCFRKKIKKKNQINQVDINVILKKENQYVFNVKNCETN